MAMFKKGITFIFIFSALSVLCCRAQEIPETVTRTVHTVADTGQKVWVYLPKESKSESLPCVLIAPAGSALFHGMALADGDIAEHVPYAEAGFAVIAYELSGLAPTVETDEAYAATISAFVKSDGGIKNAVTALRLAAAKHPSIDTKRVYVAGHSSAGTIALTIAQKTATVKGCIVYAPVIDLANGITQDVITEADGWRCRLGDYVRNNSPLLHMGKIKCPLFLFNAKDDEKALVDEIQQYAEKFKSKTFTHIEVESGGHYKSMIREGIPKGIEWLKKMENP